MPERYSRPDGPAPVPPDDRVEDLGAIARRYRADGYAVVEGLFEAHEVELVRSALDELFRGYPTLPAGFGYNLAAAPGGGGTSGIPAIRDVLKLRPDLLGLAGLARAVHLVEQLEGGGAEPLWDAAVYKAPRDPNETPWHQDRAIYALRRMPRPRSICYFWLALTDVDGASSAIRFIPGSHRGPLLPHRWSGAGGASPEFDGGAVDVSAGVAPRLRAGDATIHHALTLHGSGPNASEDWRRAWVLGIGTPRSPRWLRRLKGALRRASPGSLPGR